MLRKRSVMKAKDLMSRKVVTVGPDATVAEVAKLFVERRITGVPVVEDGKLLGVVSQTDLARRERASIQAQRTAHSFYRRADDDADHTAVLADVPHFNHVIDIMTPAVLSADEETPARDLAQMMLRKRIHRLLITRKGKLCGIVTSMDVLRAFVKVS